MEGSGGRNNLTSGNLVIQNNKIHNTDRFVVTYAPAVYLENCVGTQIEHNELYDAVQMLVNLVGCNNIQINYNNIYDAATLFDDTGAIYYGRDMSTMGIEIKYNYFHDIGNKLHSQYGSSSIFCDDFVPGPKIYGNIFYHGSISSDNGGQPRYDSVVRTYFGQFLQMQNNIVIDAPSGFAYGTYNSGKMFRWLMTMYSVKPYDMGWNLWDKMTDFIENPAWLEHYGSGQWSYFAKLKPEYKEQLDALSEKYDYQLLQTSAYETELTAFAESCGFFDKNSKTFSKNLLIKVDQPIWTGDWAKDTVLVEQNYNMTYQAAQNAFTEFGTDFTLTEDALAQIRQSIPDFEKIDFKSIGNQPYILNGVTQMPGGTQPNVSQLSVEGEKVENGLVKAAYQWNDADSNIEGYSKITWYLSDSENGTYTEMQNGPVKEFTIPQQTAGQYLKYTITPIDCRGVRGTTVSSSPVLIINPSDASLKDLQVNFDPNKTEYALFLNEVPTIEAIPVNNDAICQIEMGRTLPTEAVITITAPDGVTQKIYRIKIQKLEQTSPTPSSLPTSGPGSSQPPSNQQTIGGIVLIGGNNAPQQTERKFTDIIGHWAENDINEMAKRGVVSGVTDTTFEPARAITRAEFAALISRSLRLTATNQQSVFEDVPSNAWYANEVAAAAGLITGYERYFRPEDLITREEMAVIVVKAYVFSGKTPASGTLDMFADRTDISDWAVSFAEQAAGTGLIRGITANTFAPHDIATRAQATSILKRLLDL